MLGRCGTQNHLLQFGKSGNNAVTWVWLKLLDLCFVCS
jgi:hypothetical protein